MYQLEVQPPAGELAFHETWEAAPAVTLAVTGARVDHFEVGGASRTRLALAVEAHNGSDEPFELVNELGLLDAGGAFRRHTWVDPAKRPSALPAVRLLAPGERVTGEVFVPIEVDAADAPVTFTPAVGTLSEAGDCGGCGREHRVVVTRAAWQSVVLQPSVATAAAGDAIAERA